MSFMFLFISSAAVAAVANAAACTSSTCPVPVSNPSAYTISLSTLSNAASVNSALGSSTFRSVSQVLSEANRDKASLSSCRPSPAGLSPSAEFGFCWNDEDQGGDSDFMWFPQGITTTADALSGNSYDDVELLAVTWYKRDADGSSIQSRVSLASAKSSTGKYRHILLVQPSGTNDIAHTPCHAGGAMWYGNKLYVACTTTIRIYDWNHLHEVKTTSLPGEGFGRQSDGKFYANGNRYVLLQSAVISSSNIRFSSLSLDRLSSPDQMVVSKYAEDGGSVSLWRFDLDYTTRYPKSNSAADAFVLPFALVQGATSRENRFWFHSSGSAPKLRFWHRGENEITTYTGEYGAESVSYWSSGDGAGGVPDYLFTLTEHRNRREVFAVKQASFDG